MPKNDFSKGPPHHSRICRFGCFSVNSLTLWRTLARLKSPEQENLEKHLSLRDEISNFYVFMSAAIWVFPKIWVPQMDGLLMENPIEMDDLGGKPTIFGNIHIMILTLLQAATRRSSTFPRLDLRLTTGLDASRTMAYCCWSKMSLAFPSNLDTNSLEIKARLKNGNLGIILDNL